MGGNFSVGKNYGNGDFDIRTKNLGLTEPQRLGIHVEGETAETLQKVEEQLNLHRTEHSLQMSAYKNGEKRYPTDGNRTEEYYKL